MDRKLKGSRVRNNPRVELEVPVNLEQVLLRAAGDPAFRRELLEDAQRALEENDIRLTQSEARMLATMDRATLESMIRRLGAGKRRSVFARRVATAVAGSLILAVSTCSDTAKDGGMAPDTGTSDVAEEDVAEETAPDA